MEGKAREKAFLGRRSVPGGGFFQLRQIPHDADDVGTEAVEAADVVGFEEAPPQHDRHVLLLYGLHALLSLPPEHVGQLGGQPAAQLAALLVRVGGQYRGDHRRGVDLAYRLGQILEEIDDALAPDGIEARLLAGVHQHLVDQDQRRQPPLAGDLQQRGQQRLRGRRLPLRVQPIGVHCAQPFRAGELERQHAPGMAQRPRFAVGSAHALDTSLGIDLVETERYRERRRQIHADVLAELLHRGQIRQCVRVAEQMMERDQRVRLPAAIGQLELPHRLVALPGEPCRHVLHQLAQRVGRIGQREEFRRVLVDRPASLRLRDLVQVGGEFGEREFTGSKLLLQADDFVPGPGAVRLGHGARRIRRGWTRPPRPRWPGPCLRGRVRRNLPPTPAERSHEE